MGCKLTTSNPYPGPSIRVRRESTHRSLTPLIPPPGRTPTPPPGESTPPPYSPWSLDYSISPTPDEEEEVKEEEKKTPETSNYKENYRGLFYRDAYDFRVNPEKMDRDFSDPPTVKPFVDKDFGPNFALEGAPDVEWKRPREFRDAPVLFSEGTTRYDIGQGCAGTCWFLSTLALLADKPKYFHKVVPKDAWNEEGGYFYCTFWRFGEWETVYIDDFLPTYQGTHQWGAKSKDNDQEMWPAFLEKAFARFHGKYNTVYGGQPGDAFLALTGGCSEYVNFEKVFAEKGNAEKKSIALHRRMKNAINSGESMIITSVPKKNDGHCGLVGGHAYSISDAITTTSNGQPVHLIRVRNPWGNTEWTGDWSDKSPEWKTVEANSVPFANIDDGEFWIRLDDFIKYFDDLTVCYFIPDFDKDGCADSLNHVTPIYGEWAGKTAAGCKNTVNNPRFMFEVTNEGMDEDGKVPVLLQLCQKIKHRKLSETFAIRPNLFKLKGKRTMVRIKSEFDGPYMYERSNCARFKVEPGEYLAVPSCFKAGQESEFLIHVYTPSPIYKVRKN